MKHRYKSSILQHAPNEAWAEARLWIKDGLSLLAMIGLVVGLIAIAMLLQP